MPDHPIDTQWLTDTLTDAQETLEEALNLLHSNPRHAQGVLEHEIPALYAKLNYAVNTARIGPDAVNTLDHKCLTAWPSGEDFDVFCLRTPRKSPGKTSTKSRPHTAK